MPIRIVRTARDEEIFEALTLRVRLLSLALVLATWWPTAREQTVRARLRRLELAGLLRRDRLLVAPLPSIDGPIFSWPEDGTPDLAKISYQLRSRWTEPLSQTTVWFATDLLARQYAGFSGLKNPLHASHDLVTSAAWCLLYRTDSQQAQDWRGEDTYARRFNKNESLPDAMCFDESGAAYRCHEAGGIYTRKHCEKFCRWAESHNLPYCIW